MTVLREGLIIAERDLRHWRRQPWTPVMNLAFTIMLLLMFAVILGGSIQLPGGGEYISYLLPGMLAVTMLFGLEATMTAMATDAKKGVTDRFRSLPISSPAVALGRVGADMTTALVELAVLFGGGLAIGWRITGSASAAVLAVLLLLWLRLAMLWVGIFLGLTLGRTEGATMAVQALVWPAGFLSTAFVSPEFMPGWLGWISTLNPLSATATAIRGLFGNPTGMTTGWLAEHALLAAVTWPAVLLVVFVPLSARAYRRLRR
ncbi:ABC transporter permease [Brachybacterium sp. FME24]|uniref:ABC transporter permease n=1 Tax=Brachybacterium sp. FME24 TaxID=2742605 RepID=UPI001866E082|nr:ABC transporter permease [Brachybacterium sp. FME24]